ncbi:MAG: right-handed parallel beta-helix repeat-containing protein [Pseudomonadota bacterium]
MSRFFTKPTHSQVALIALVLTCLISCTSINTVNTTEVKGRQSGELLQIYLAEYASTETTSIINALERYKGPEQVELLVKQYQAHIASLYSSGVLQYGLRGAKSARSTALSSLTPEEAIAIFALFPIDSAKWVKLLATHSKLTQHEIAESAITAGLDPSRVFTATASGMPNTVTPLIHSLGIVIYGQNETSTNTVRFKSASQSTWIDALPLSWEPVFGSFAGSIVYLEPNTLYDIEVTVHNSDNQVQVYRFQEATQPNTPPIDPNKIYYLSDIYDGGQLDLEALNIQGSPIGYAKIIGDGPVIDAGNEFTSAVHLGSQSYVVLENLTVRGGLRYGIHAKKAHHIWISGCDVAEFGRVAGDIRDNIAYSSPTANSPINYDSGIYLERSGIAVIEECDIHSPNLGSNHWGDGHPKGANALQVWAYHDDESLRGQMIVRNNRFYGTHEHRFNDVVEGRLNFERRGGFVRDSAIYGNYFAYANDDLIEIDGGQQNVLVYDNEMEQGYAGISIAPNMLGPSFIFHNTIRNLGDERGKQWTAIKAGGLISKPAGQTLIFENFISGVRNGIAGSKVNDDTTFWITSQNNVYLTENTGYSVGYCIFDQEKYYLSSSTNDLCFNNTTMDIRYEFNSDKIIEHIYSNNLAYIESLMDSDVPSLYVSEEYEINNFSSRVGLQAEVKGPQLAWEFRASEIENTDFPEQYRYGTTTITEDNSVTLTGNNWQMFPISYTLTESSVLELELEVEGTPEVVGVGFETDTKLNSSRVVKFYGKQSWGIRGEDAFSLNSSAISFPIGQYIIGNVNYLILLLDNDDIESWRNKDKAVFKHIIIK